jgi:plastocyanin
MSVQKLALAVTLALAIGGCGSAQSASQDPDDGQRAPAKVTVDVYPNGYRPAEAEVLVGGSITWIGRDRAGEHTAETDRGRYANLPGGENQDFDTHTLTWGEPYTVTFHKPGTYSYHCSFHFGMKGTVTAVERVPPEEDG